MEYKIIGNVVPAVEFTMKKGDKLYTQSGGMTWKTDGIEMSTDTGGGLKKVLGRMVTGENLFVNHYEAVKDGAEIGFASTMPGKILPLAIKPDVGIYAQRCSFLCAQESVKVSVSFTKRMTSGMFGGEGFILQDITGEGMVFLEVDGDLVEKTLAPGEAIYVDTGNIVCFDKSCQYELEVIKGAKNLVFGGEGFFMTKIIGPGKVVLQTQNFNDFANKILAQQPTISTTSNNGDDDKGSPITFNLFK